MKKLKPNRLRPGQNLGIIAVSNPATGLNPVFRKRAYDRIRDLLGVNIIEAPNLDLLEGHAAGTVKERVRSIHEFFRRKDIHGIMSFWGGMNSHQVLEYLDFDLIKNHPKVLIGYSDTTNLLSGITQKTGLVTFNGPAVITFAKPVVPLETQDCFKQLLTTGISSYLYPVAKRFSDNPWWQKDEMIFAESGGRRCYRKGAAEGVSVGGNVGTLLLLAGTPYWPSMKGKILFVEDDEVENTKTIDRYFTQLRQMGVFEQISGLVIGRFPRSVGFTETDSLHRILDDALRGYRFPVITEFDMGHTDPLLTVPLGINVRINASRTSIEILEKVVL